MTNIQQEEGTIKPKIGLYFDDDGNISRGLATTYCGVFNDNDGVEFYDQENQLQVVKLNDILALAGKTNEMSEVLGSRDKSNLEGYVDSIAGALALHRYNSEFKEPEVYERKVSLYRMQKAYCSNSNRYIEVAMAAQNCLRQYEKNSTFKISLVELTIHGLPPIQFIHAYNLVEEDGRYYIIDFSLPMINIGKGGYDYVVGEIDKDTYEKMVNPTSKMCDVKIKHPEILTIPEYEITYSSGRVKENDDSIETQKKV